MRLWQELFIALFLQTEPKVLETNSHKLFYITLFSSPIVILKTPHSYKLHLEF